jgi:hypothetical protein
MHKLERCCGVGVSFCTSSTKVFDGQPTSIPNHVTAKTGAMSSSEYLFVISLLSLVISGNLMTEGAQDNTYGKTPARTLSFQ